MRPTSCCRQWSARHQTENTIQTNRAMLRTKALVLTTSLLRARFAMRHFGGSRATALI